ncbi:5'-nucleotidase domain-containing protein isoform 1 [Schistosoma japonicum]|uniref:5'-nucleotidase domain-containing protein isoform 1 n=3 Tax=Schistosoma japonicum TaxID=6182 RepID=A0A4Z2D033_SCHJA|nr:5'-nucleotidase domain-containing protein 3 [Schistosoma japonicum]KAH8853374.1 5'-nucleotidase domain-containing protein 3 [Schistosoma japonicum]KAH8853376.1 5'-nucleotidase domain-containing protein 3 [Schistosoma japonicum]TNN09814.1 5'-nucleotidase domain-containing protein isoform 1 [Schistosoma japonicum]
MWINRSLNGFVNFSQNNFFPAFFNCFIKCHRKYTLYIVSRNLSNSTNSKDISHMLQRYALLDQECKELISTLDQVNPRDIFVNNEVKLGKIQVYGFDYDYTLAHYTSELDKFIFNESRNWLVEQMKYPEEILNYEYTEFAKRGLHFDVKRGLLMKVDAFHHIQLDTVYRGFTLLSLDEILKVYRGSHLANDILKQKFTPNDTVMLQLMDFFQLPEINLLCSIIAFFDRRGIDYKPFYVYQDVSTAVARVHKSGLLGQTVMSNPEKYIAKDPQLRTFLHRLVENDKKLFVISNSSAAYIDKGLKFLVGNYWQELFDVIISRANKPTFFKSPMGQFRRTDVSGTFKHWEAVQTFKRGHIYEGGCLEQMIKLTGWCSASILYFGDHVYADLADVASTYGWMTGAVIPELETELIASSDHDFKINLRRLRMLEKLIQENQHVCTLEAKLLLEKWFDERNALRRSSKFVFDPHFGSIFRSFHNPSYFSQRLGQYATLYTSRVTNLLRFTLDHTFFPKRTALPHESY